MRNNAVVQVGRGPLAARFGASLPLAVIAGPCQIESRAHALETAAALKEIAARRAVGLVYKSSFDKANRTTKLDARSPRTRRLPTANAIAAEDVRQNRLPELLAAAPSFSSAKGAEGQGQRRLRLRRCVPKNGNAIMTAVMSQAIKSPP